MKERRGGITGVKGRREIHSVVEGLPMNLPCIGGCAGDMWGACGRLGVLVGGTQWMLGEG